MYRMQRTLFLTAWLINPRTLPSPLNIFTTLERVSQTNRFPSAQTFTPIGKLRPSSASVCRPKLPRNWVFTANRQCAENIPVHQSHQPDLSQAGHELLNYKISIFSNFIINFSAFTLEFDYIYKTHTVLRLLRSTQIFNSNSNRVICIVLPTGRLRQECITKQSSVCFLVSNIDCDDRHKTRSSAIAEGPRDASCQLKSCQLPRNSAETTYTTSPDQIDGMKL